MRSLPAPIDGDAVRWLRRLLGLERPRLELRFLSYAEADALLRSGAPWRIAPEEDQNRDRTHVYLERYAEEKP